VASDHHFGAVAIAALASLVACAAPERLLPAERIEVADPAGSAGDAPDDPRGDVASDHGEAGPESSDELAEARRGGAHECASSFDCTLVKDDCGRIHGAPLARPAAPHGGGPCARARQARVRPACDAGACVAEPIEDPDWTTCATTADCTTAPWPCSPPIAIARTHLAEASAAARRLSTTRACRAPATTPTPRVECLMTACVARAPR
jgi:hypothetical protein